MHEFPGVFTAKFLRAPKGFADECGNSQHKKVQNYKDHCSYSIKLVEVVTALSNPPPAFERLVALGTGLVEGESPALPAREAYQPQARLTEIQRQELISRYVAGERAFRLAAEFGLHRESVTNVLVKAGVRRPRVMTEPERVKAAWLYGQGWTCKRIGEEFGRSKDAVRRALHEAGVELRDGRNR